MAESSNPQPKRKSSKKNVEIIDVTVEDLAGLAERLHERKLQEGDYELILKILFAYDHVLNLLKHDQTSLNRLRRMLFGSTERLKKVLEKAKEQNETAQKEGSGEDDQPADSTEAESSDKPSAPGHGRNGADQYRSAPEEYVEHETLKSGDQCPECGKGKLYEIEPTVMVRVSGQAPLQATIYRMQRLRCKTCGKLFHATPPADAQGKKFDETAAAMIALLKYGSGMPFNRLARLEESLGVPLPASTQWDVVSAYLSQLEPVFEALVREVSTWELFHNDDTTIKILKRVGLKVPPQKEGEPSRERKGTFTTAIVARRPGRDAVLYFSSYQHAGENLRDVLQHRPEELTRPLQMCDALSRNMPEDLKTIVANCLVHARRNFVDVATQFPEEVEYVLKVFAEVYRVDREAKKKRLTPEKRLKLHRAKSGRVMDGLRRWLERQTEDRLVEPNSGLGQAIAYMLKHWEKLTLFLRVPGAPLDNNIAERALKEALAHCPG